jgi:xanthine dehydrogenase accessory factor
MFDLVALQAAIAAHGPVARVVIAAHDGSSPREVGAAMLVWETGQAGTIGGGALEWDMLARARAMLVGVVVPCANTSSGGDASVDQTPLFPPGGSGGVKPPASPSDGRDIGRLSTAQPAAALGLSCLPPAVVGEGWSGHAPLGGPSPDSGEVLAAGIDRIALGPSLGQCCGGAVTVLTEVYARAPVGPVVARSIDGRAMPLAVKRMLARARGEGVMPAPTFLQGWMVEPVMRPLRQVWVWGAGHVGRAVVGVLAPLPGVSIVWCDVDRARFPDLVPDGVRVIARDDLAAAVAAAGPDAEHLVMTYSHALDLDLCHRLLGHGFAHCGLIGSATKWARFRSRLAALGHAPGAIARIDCPIGDPSLGKHPQAIAIGVATAFLAQRNAARKAAHG